MKFGSFITAVVMGAVLAVPVSAQERYSARDYNAPYITQQSRAGMAQDMVSGPVHDLRQINLAGLRQSHLLGKVTVPDGRVAHVNFGPVAALSGMNLQNGGHVTVWGIPGAINDRPMLMANRVEARGQTMTVQMPDDLQITPYTGRILDVRTTSFQDRNVPEQVFARVQLDNGATTAVNLGPRTQLREVDMKNLEGKRISFLAHPALIKGERALVADELRVDGHMITINRTA